MAFGLLPGHRSEVKAAPDLLFEAWQLGAIGFVVCDRGYSSSSWRNLIREVGAEPVVPATSAHPAVNYDRLVYQRRSRVEQLWGRLKEWRAVATRYEKTASSYLGVLHIAAALDWIHHILT